MYNQPNDDTITPKKWYREPWCWFVLAPLIVVVLVSSVTVTLAVKGADDRVVEDYYKQGRMINVSLEADERAVALGVSARIVVDHLLQEVVVDITPYHLDLPESLQLEILHPARSAQDQLINVRLIASGRYQAELQQPVIGRRYLRLAANYEDDTPSWRLRGEATLNPQADKDTSSLELRAEG